MAMMIFLLVAIQICGSLGNSLDVLENYMALRAVASDVNKFSSEFYQAVSKAENDNLIASPISASLALSMLTYGARGNSEKQLKSVLHFNSDAEVQKRGVKTLIENLNEFAKVDLKLANKIFLAENVTVNPEFMEVTESVFKSAVQNVDYSEPEEASKTINSWCEQQTNSKIKDLFSADDFDNDTGLVLVNAVYFKGNWLQKFDANLTTSKKFTLEDGTTKKVPTMNAYRDYRFGVLEDLGARFVELPYESNDISDGISMFIVLPNEPSGLKDLQQNLTKLDLNRLLSGSLVKVNLSLPKFKVESKLDLKAPLSDLGLKDIFEDSADLTGILSAEAPHLKVNKIVQKAFIEVNEEGSEAAAATGIEATTFSAPIPIDFHVDRPFYYAIVKRLGREEGGVVLFSGYYKTVD
ncbi:leukocyte elastase inhibitor isoform X2 [Diachasma alloeum]|uniref:leukocyte elastase inhibitor isoform X2 n=1 Tax=Diachasma alloeum TaxID=454923 RepID=UPI00073831CC|nr:leukocyte elastase inhibitor isoform X2 [Diachasma alloeum]